MSSSAFSTPDAFRSRFCVRVPSEQFLRSGRFRWRFCIKVATEQLLRKIPCGAILCPDAFGDVFRVESLTEPFPGLEASGGSFASDGLRSADRRKTCFEARIAPVNVSCAVLQQTGLQRDLRYR